MQMDEILKEINRLAKKSKIKPLTESEKKLQVELRKKYLELFRKSFEKQILNIRVIDENNNDVTPEKILEKNKGKNKND